jgi:capsular polysaccharide biosynthesis protein
MELRRYLRLIRQRLLLVAVAIIAGAGVGYVATSRTPFYTASATIYVGAINLGPGNEYLFEEGDLNEIVSTYSVMIPQPVIAQKALDATHIDRFAGEVAASTSATVLPDTQLIQVSVTDPNSSVAIRLANGVSRAFVAQISDYAANTKASQGAVPNEPAHVYQEATYASAADSGLVKRMILGGVFGLIISIFVIFLLDYLDITIKSPDELERRVGLPVLGIIPRFDTLRLDAGPAGLSQRQVPRGSSG